jgi:hypothetical protein
MIENDMIPCCPYSIDSIDIADSVFMCAFAQSHHGETTKWVHRKNCTVLCQPPYRLGIAAWPTLLRASSPYDHAPTGVPAVSAAHEGVVEEGKRCGNRICPFWISALAPSQNGTLHFKMRDGIEQDTRGSHPATTCWTRRCRRPPTEHGCRMHSAGTCFAPPPCCQVF